MRTQLRPLAVLDGTEGFGASLILEVPGSRDLVIDIPQRDLAAVRAGFEGRAKGLSLFDLWCSGDLVDAQYTEVSVEVVDGQARFALVLVGEGSVWRTLVDAVDAMLTGLHFGLPFFMGEPSTPARKPQSASARPSEIDRPRRIISWRALCSMW